MCPRFSVLCTNWTDVFALIKEYNTIPISIIYPSICIIDGCAHACVSVYLLFIVLYDVGTTVTGVAPIFQWISLFWHRYRCYHSQFHRSISLNFIRSSLGLLSNFDMGWITIEPNFVPMEEHDFLISSRSIYVRKYSILDASIRNEIHHAIVCLTELSELCKIKLIYWKLLTSVRIGRKISAKTKYQSFRNTENQR